MKSLHLFSDQLQCIEYIIIINMYVGERVEFHRMNSEGISQTTPNRLKYT